MKKLLLVLALVSFHSVSQAEPVTRTDRILKSDLNVPGKAVLVEYYSPDCGICKIENPIIHSLAKEFDGQLKVIMVQDIYLPNGRTITGYPEFHLYSVNHHEEVKNGGPSYNTLANWIRTSGL